MVAHLLCSICAVKAEGLTLSGSGFDNLCPPFVQLELEILDHAAHLRPQIGPFGVVPGHLDRLLAEGIRDVAFAAAHLSENHGHRMPQAVERRARADLAIPFELQRHLAPRGPKAAVRPRHARGVGKG